MRKKQPGLRNSMSALLATGNKQIFELTARSMVGSYILNWFLQKARDHKAFSERVRWDVQSDSRDGCFNKIILVERIDVYIIFGKIGNIRIYINRVSLSHVFGTLVYNNNRNRRRPRPNHFW